MEDINVTATPSNVLTEENVQAIGDVIQQEVEKNENLKMVSELPSNNGVEEHELEEGYEKKTKVFVNPFTGEQTSVGDASEEVEDTSFEDMLEDFGDSVEDVRVDLTADDIKNFANSEEDSLLGKYDITDETALELLKLVNKKQDGAEIKFKDLPKQVAEYVDKYLASNGVVGYSKEANTARNTVAEMLIDEYITQIGLEKLNEEFNTQLENLYSEAGKELSPLFKEYNESREQYLAQATANIEDEEKKKLAEKILDSIHDAFELSRIKTLDHTIKIKKYYHEEPEKVYKDCVENKYIDTKYHIYQLSMIQNILDRHLKQNGLIPNDDEETSANIILGFALFCRNYNIDNPEEHAFMYYFTYNVVLLDIYKEDNYIEFSKDFLANCMGILNAIR